MSNDPEDTRDDCSSDKCETSPDAPFNKDDRPLGTAQNKRPNADYQDEIEKQKQYYKGGKKP